MADTLPVPAGFTRQAFRALDTDVALLLPESVAGHWRVAAHVFVQWESVFSRSEPRSEIAFVNGNAGYATRVSPLFGYVTARALHAAEASDGVFDPTTGTVTGGWREIRLVGDEITVPAGVELDYRGIATGMAVDAAVTQLASLGVSAAAVSAGPAVAVHGSRQPQGGGWPIGVRQAAGGRAVSVAGGAVSSSTSVDARATVVARRCEQAQVAARCAARLGPRMGVAFLERRRLQGVIVTAAGDSSTAGWPE